jgi:hypothetical protein
MKVEGEMGSHQQILFISVTSTGMKRAADLNSHPLLSKGSSMFMGSIIYCYTQSRLKYQSIYNLYYFRKKKERKKG